MNVLIIGSGGREHALAWKVAQDPRVAKVFVAPGNAGTATEAKCENVAIDVLALEQLADFAAKNVQLTIVGPEAPLVAGVVDLFRERGLKAGDSLALVCSNRAEFVEVLAATLRAGIRITPVNWHLTPDEIAYIIKDCEAKILVGEQPLQKFLALRVAQIEGDTLLIAIGDLPPQRLAVLMRREAARAGMCCRSASRPSTAVCPKVGWPSAPCTRWRAGLTGRPGLGRQQRRPRPQQRRWPPARRRRQAPRV